MKGSFNESVDSNLENKNSIEIKEREWDKLPEALGEKQQLDSLPNEISKESIEAYEKRMADIERTQLCIEAYESNLLSKPEEWETLSEPEKKEQIKLYADEVSKALDLREYEIQYEDWPSLRRGSFDGSIVRINSDVLENNSDYREEIVDTISHELRHAFQREACHNPEKYGVDKTTAAIWKYNFEHYITYEMWSQGYFEQAVEEDASAFSSGIIGGLEK